MSLRANFSPLEWTMSFNNNGNDNKSNDTYATLKSNSIHFHFPCVHLLTTHSSNNIKMKISTSCMFSADGWNIMDSDTLAHYAIVAQINKSISQIRFSYLGLLFQHACLGFVLVALKKIELRTQWAIHSDLCVVHILFEVHIWILFRTNRLQICNK